MTELEQAIAAMVKQAVDMQRGFTNQKRGEIHARRMQGAKRDCAKIVSQKEYGKRGKLYTTKNQLHRRQSTIQAYDEQKAMMQMATGYTEWGDKI